MPDFCQVMGLPFAVREDLFGDWLWERLGSPAITPPNNKHVTIQEGDLSGPIPKSAAISCEAATFDEMSEQFLPRPRQINFRAADDTAKRIWWVDTTLLMARSRCGDRFPSGSGSFSELLCTVPMDRLWREGWHTDPDML